MLHPLHVFLHLLLASFAARRDVQIRFLIEQNRILLDRLTTQRLILTPQERGRLLKIGSQLDHQVQDILTLVQIRTYRLWIKDQKAGITPRRVGRPRQIGTDIRKLILRIARQNPGWGYLRIVGELLKLRITISKTSVRKILHEAGIHPTPPTAKRPYDAPDAMPWDQFLKLHINTLVACDFFCKTIVTPFGKRHAFLLMFIHLGSRKVWVSPATYHPNAVWMNQQARNLLMWLDDHHLPMTHLLRDRDGKFQPLFDTMIKTSGAKILRSPVRAPNANAFAEAWIASVKRECLNYFTCFGLKHLDFITNKYVRFYNEHRPHQRMENRPLKFPTEAASQPHHQKALHDKVDCTSTLGGLLKHYHYRNAA